MSEPDWNAYNSNSTTIYSPAWTVKPLTPIDCSFQSINNVITYAWIVEGWVDHGKLGRALQVAVERHAPWFAGKLMKQVGGNVSYEICAFLYKKYLMMSLNSAQYAGTPPSSAFPRSGLPIFIFNKGIPRPTLTRRSAAYTSRYTNRPRPHLSRPRRKLIIVLGRCD
jgi:hypothetical protein